MSDFVSRVAARAVGRPAGAQPRLPALFEPSGPGPGGLEVVEEAVAAPPVRSGREPTVLRAARVDEAAPAPSTRPTPAPAAPTAQLARAEQRQAGRGDLSDDVSPAGVRAAREEATAPIDPVTAVAAERLAAPAELEVIEVAAAPAAPEPPVAPAQPLAPAIPVVPPAAAASPPPPAVTVEQPPVRIHIGRLEVRAVLEAPARPQRARERPRPEEVSLGDYLRGRRAGT